MVKFPTICTLVSLAPRVPTEGLRVEAGHTSGVKPRDTCGTYFSKTSSSAYRCRIFDRNCPTACGIALDFYRAAEQSRLAIVSAVATDEFDQILLQPQY